MKAYCKDRQLKVNHSGKLVVATDEQELEGFYELKRRGDANGVELQ